MTNTKVLFVGGPLNGEWRVLPGGPERNIQYRVPVRNPISSFSELCAEILTDVDFDNVYYRLCKLIDSTGIPIWIMVTEEVRRAGIIESLVRGYRDKEDAEGVNQ